MPTVGRTTWWAIALLLAAMASSAYGAELATQLRRPTAALLSSDDRWLFVAGERSGTLSIIDLESRQVAREVTLGKGIRDLAATPDRRVWLALDGPGERLHYLATDGKKDVRLTEQIEIGPSAQRVVVSDDGRRAYVSHRWSRRISVVDLTSGGGPSRVATIDLEIAPHELLLVDGDKRLIAADAFNGELAVIDTAERRQLHTSRFPAHNIRGLATTRDGTKLVVAHQMLNELGHTVENDVHWGLVMTNDLRWLKLASVLTGAGDLYQGAHMHPLGQPNQGSGDPAGLAVAADGRVVVTLGGVGEIAFGREEDFSLHRLRVGRRPTAVTITRDSRTALVVDTFGECVYRVDLDERRVTDTIGLGPVPELSLAERGELLFYDARLSHDGWMSCHSCHTDGHTNGQRNDNFSDSTFGAPKRVLSLRTTTDSAPFGWRGTAATLEEQIEKSIVHTMQGGQKPSSDELKALAAYLKTLTPPPSTAALRGTADADAIERGQSIFAEQKCTRCHTPPAYTSPKLYNVGLKDELDHDTFNPPSLLGVGQRAPYFHDGRAATLVDVFREHRHRLQRDLSNEELSDLVQFLQSL